MRRFHSNTLLVGLSCAIFFTGCTNPIYRQGNLTQGTFEIGVPDNFTGVGKELPRKSSIKGISLSLNYTTKDEMKMKDVHNAKLKESDIDPLVSDKDNYTIMSRTKINDFRYKRNRFPASFAFTHLLKTNSPWLGGYSIGFDPGLYVRISGGFNMEHFEVGGYLDLGLYNLGDVSFDYYECTTYTKSTGCTETSEVKHFKEKNVRQARLGGGAYTSFYWNGFALSYSPMIYLPSIVQEYELKEKGVYNEETFDFITRVELPFVLSQYIGASKWINSHWKVALGATLLSSLNFNGGVYPTANTSLGYWF